MACDPFWNKTVLACHFDGPNGSTTFTDEKGHTLTANGNAQISAAQSMFGGSSLYLDGTGDYLSVPPADFAFGGGDFTIEAFIRASTVAPAYQAIVDMRNASQQTVPTFSLFGALPTFYTAGGIRIQGGELSINTMYHVALCRKSGSTRLFVDGNQVGSTYVDANSYGASQVLIGSHFDGNAFNGYIDDLRITKAARYTAPFTPDTSAFLTNQCAISGTVKDAAGDFAARLVRTLRRDSCEMLNASMSNGTTGVYSHEVEATTECMVLANDGTPTDPYAANVKLALKMAGANGSTTFTDDAGHTTTANGDVKIVSGAFPYQRSAAYFDGTGDFIACTYSTDYEVGSGDFTIEFWFNVPNVGGQKTMFAFQADFHIGVFLNGNRMNCFASSNGSAWDIISGDSGGSYGAGFVDVTANVWHHFAWVRSGSTWTMWLDGRIDRQLTGYAQTVFSRNEALNIGRWGNAGYFMAGHIKDFRLTKAARYTAPFPLPLPDFIPFPSSGTENAVILDRVVPA